MFHPVSLINVEHPPALNSSAVVTLADKKKKEDN